MTTKRWRQKLRLAKFRGAEFHVESHQLSGGRRGVTHEYPDKDMPFHEDTGRKAQSFSIEAYVLGANYTAARDKLLIALEKFGPGELIHHYLGRKIVNCVDFSLKETQSEGGYATFSITFKEAGEAEFPNTGTDAKTLAEKAGLDLNGAAKGDFAGVFDVIGAPQYVLDSATEKQTDFSDTLDSAVSGFPGNPQQIADFAYSLRNLKARATDLIKTPSELANQMENSFNLLLGALDPSNVLSAAQKMFSFGDDDAPIQRVTATRVKQDNNRFAMNELVQNMAISTATRAAVQKEYASVNDAQDTFNVLGAKLDEQMETTQNDDVFIGLQNLRTQAANAIPPADETLARVTNFEPLQSVPSVVLAYDFYESIELEDDIINRNNIRHPGFVPGGKNLELLDRG